MKVKTKPKKVRVTMTMNKDEAKLLRNCLLVPGSSLTAEARTFGENVRGKLTELIVNNE